LSQSLSLDFFAQVKVKVDLLAKSYLCRSKKVAMGKTYSSKIKEVNIRPNFCREKTYSLTAQLEYLSAML